MHGLEKIHIVLLSFICVFFMLAMMGYIEKGRPLKHWGAFMAACVVFVAINIKFIMLEKKLKELEENESGSKKKKSKPNAW